MARPSTDYRAARRNDCLRVFRAPWTPLPVSNPHSRPVKRYTLRRPPVRQNCRDRGQKASAARRLVGALGSFAEALRAVMHLTEKRS